jgi:drug/metabolite transporter (DMT)-like permease
MSDHAIGVAMALGTAVVWSMAVLLLRRGGQFGPIATNLFKNTVGSVLIALTLLVVGPEDLLAIAPTDAVMLVVSGVLGIAIGDILFLAALARLGAAWMAVIDCAYAPTVVVIAVLWLGEPFGVAFAVGVSLVALGLVIASWRRGSDEPVASGMLLGLISIVVVAVAVVIAKPALGRTGLIAATAVRLFAGLFGQILVQIMSRRGRRAFAIFKQPLAWKTLLPASVLGTWLSMILWLGGIKYTEASTAAVLNQTATIFTLVGARFILLEPVPARRWWGAVIAAAGAAVVATV